MKYKELNQRIDDMKGEIIEGIRQSVSIYSVKSNPEPDAPFGKGPKDALENAIEQAEKLGLKAKNIDNMIGYAEIALVSSAPTPHMPARTLLPVQLLSI